MKIRFAVLAIALITGSIWTGIPVPVLPVTPALASPPPISTCDAASLNSAITAANPGDTVSFACSGTITLATPITINKTLTIDGSGNKVTIDGNNQTQIFVVATSATATAGITFSLKGVTLTHATTSGEGGAVYVPGGGPYQADLVINNVTFASNTGAAYGSAIESDYGNVTVINSTFTGNSSTIHGGAINNNEAPGPNNQSNYYKTTLSGDTFSNNSSPDGGAIALGSNSPMSVINSTFSGNTASVDGDAIFTYTGVSLLFNTIANNSGSGNALGFGNSGGSYTLKGDILDNPANANCSAGSVTDSGYNVEWPYGCNPGNSTKIQDPLLGPLEDNGGPTQTMATSDGSPAVDAMGDCTDLSSPVQPVTADQRGVARPSGTCDIGAYQRSLLQNGSFERPSVSGYAFSSNIPGWSVCSAPQISGGPAQSIEVDSNSAIGPAQDGTQLVELNSTGPSDVCQTVSTTPGQSYQLSFYFSARGGIQASNNKMDVTWTDNTTQQVTDLTPTNITADLSGAPLNSTSWTRYTYTVTATSTSETVQFSDTGTASDPNIQSAPGGCFCGSLLDNVQLTTQVSPGPAFTPGENGAFTWGGTSANPFAVTGTAQPSDTVTLYNGSGCNGSAVGTATANGSGNWSIPVTGIQSDGSFTFSANESNSTTGTSACSGPIMINVDRTRPSSAVGFPASGSSVAHINASSWSTGCSAVVGVCGTASDSGGSGIQAVYVAIENTTGGFWNGSSFGSSGAWLPATLTPNPGGGVNWSLAVTRPGDGAYTVASAAIDNAGNTESTFANVVNSICTASGTGGQLSLNGGQLSLNGGLCTVSGTNSSNQTVSGQLSLNGGQLSLNGGQLSLNGGQLSLNGGQLSLNSGTCTVTDGSGTSGQLSLNGGQLSMNGGQLSLNGGQLSLNGGQLSLNGGQLSLNGGQLSLNGGSDALTGGTCSFTAANGNTGTAVLTGGTLSQPSGGQLSLNGGQLSLNGGQLSLNGGQLSLNGGQLSLNGGLGGPVGSNAGNVVVDTTPPIVSSFTVDGQSADGAVNINPGTTFHIRFNESMNCSTVNSTTITVTPSQGITAPSCDTGDTTGLNASFSGFQPSRVYTVTVNGATDLAGNVITPATFHFTTAAASPLSTRTDSDGDGIPDAWDGTSTPTFTALNGQTTNSAAWNFSSTSKDLCLVENYMTGVAADGQTYNQAISQAANQLIVNAFQRHGIHLVIFEGDATHSAGLPTTYTGPYFGGPIPMIDPLGNTTNGAFDWGHGNSRHGDAFDTIRNANFVPTGLAQFCHYAVIAHSLGGTTSTGSSRGFGASDLVIALAIGDNGVGSTMQQAGTLMHELGHNLGLHHGGAVAPGTPSGHLPADIDTNHKPNYLSVMNYSYQFTGVLQTSSSSSNQACTVGGVNLYCMLDYSEGALPSLDKTSLNETAANGLGTGAAGYAMKHECADTTSSIGFSNVLVLSATGPIDWNCNSRIDSPSSGSPEGYNVDGDSSSGPTTLNGYNDWANLNFLVGTIGLGADNTAGTESQGPPPVTSTIDVDPGESGGIDTPEPTAPIQPAAPAITWNNPADITYGTALSSTQLNASANVPGTFVYTTPAGSVLPAGNNHELDVTFTPTDTTDFTTVSAKVYINVNKATPTITWNPAGITYGAGLTSAQLDASASWVVNGSSVSVPGTFVYTPSAGAVLNPGQQTLNATFTPSDTADYNTVNPSATVSVTYQASGTCNGDAGHQILQPINVDGSSVFKQGSTVPAKFRVCDVNGNSVGTAGVVTSFKLTQTISGTASAVNESVVSTTPDTAFRWDSTNQQWIFNISTKTLSANVTYAYTISLNDGSTIQFRYGLR